MALSDSPFTKLSSFHYFLSPAVVESSTALNGAARLPCGRHQYMRRVLRLRRTGHEISGHEISGPKFEISVKFQDRHDLRDLP
jgi:hypothetical protein